MLLSLGGELSLCEGLCQGLGEWNSKSFVTFSFLKEIIA